MNPTRTRPRSEEVKYHELMLNDAEARLRAAKASVKRMQDSVKFHENAIARLTKELT